MKEIRGSNTKIDGSAAEARFPNERDTKITRLFPSAEHYLLNDTVRHTDFLFLESLPISVGHRNSISGCNRIRTGEYDCLEKGASSSPKLWECVGLVFEKS